MKHRTTKPQASASGDDTTTVAGSAEMGPAFDANFVRPPGTPENEMAPPGVNDRVPAHCEPPPDLAANFAAIPTAAQAHVPSPSETAAAAPSWPFDPQIEARLLRIRVSALEGYMAELVEILRSRGPQTAEPLLSRNDLKGI